MDKFQFSRVDVSTHDLTALTKDLRNNIDALIESNEDGVAWILSKVGIAYPL